MAKAKTIYACTECGGQSPKWQGQCPQCGVWNTLVETIAAKPATRFQALAGSASEVRSLSSVETSVNPRSPTGIEEFDRVLGGGLVAGGVILLGGDPGIGKSTLLLQAMAVMGASRRCLYVTGEESVEQIALRAQRLGLVNAPVELPAWFDQTALRVFILERQPELKAAPKPQPVGKAILLEQWRLSLPDGQKIELKGVLAEWGTLGFPNYSGWMAYDTDFTWDGPENSALLDLGEVCYAAEVFIDQVKVASAPFRPYQVMLQGPTPGSHHLEVRVLNSLANQTCGSRERELALYGSSSHPMLVADRRKIRSGMMGPVALQGMKDEG